MVNYLFLLIYSLYNMVDSLTLSLSGLTFYILEKSWCMGSCLCYMYENMSNKHTCSPIL